MENLTLPLIWRKREHNQRVTTLFLGNIEVGEVYTYENKCWLLDFSNALYKSSIKNLHLNIDEKFETEEKAKEALISKIIAAVTP